MPRIQFLKGSELLAHMVGRFLHLEACMLSMPRITEVEFNFFWGVVHCSLLTLSTISDEYANELSSALFVGDSKLSSYL